MYGVIHDNFQKRETIQVLFAKVFNKKSLKMGEQKFDKKSLSLRLQKNSNNFINNGPILLVQVTHVKFELEGWIPKLFIVKPRAMVQFCSSSHNYDLHFYENYAKIYIYNQW